MKASFQTLDFPSQHLGKYIDRFRFYHFQAPTTLDLNPEGNFEFIFQLQGDFAQKPIAETTWKIRPKNFVGGLHSKSFQVKSMGEVGTLLSVSFKPLGARHFIQDSLKSFKNDLVELDQLSKHLSVSDNLTSPHSLLQDLESSLVKEFNPIDGNVIDYAVEKMTLANGFLSISVLAKQLNISLSHLRKRFNEQIGMSPKEYSKILRVNYVISLLSDVKHGDLTKIAHDLGYHDQSHFIRDFQSITGVSPNHFTSQRQK